MSFVLQAICFTRAFRYRIDNERDSVMSDIATGRDLIKQEHAPQFLTQTVDDLESRFHNTESRAKDKFINLKVSLNLLSFTKSFF